MNESASEFGGFGFSNNRRSAAPRRIPAGSPAPRAGRTIIPASPFSESPAAHTQYAFLERCEKLRHASDAVRPLLQLQYTAADGDSAIFLCSSVRQVQRSYYVFTRGRRTVGAKTYVVHELMPRHQQDYILECLDSSCNYLLECPVALFTTAQYFQVLRERLPWLESLAEVILADGTTLPRTFSRHASDTDSAALDSPRFATEPQTPLCKHPGEPAVTCICLREGEGGRWLLTDHDDAAVVRPDEAPAPGLLPRLLNHCTEITGHELAPYLARNFDVPDAWKVYPELITKSLLIFRKNHCATGSDLPGIPKVLIWSDTLGLIY